MSYFSPVSPLITSFRILASGLLKFCINIYMCVIISSILLFYICSWFYFIVFDHKRLNCLWHCCKKVKFQNYKWKNRSSTDVSHHSLLSRGLQGNLHGLKYGRVLHILKTNTIGLMKQMRCKLEACSTCMLNASSNSDLVLQTKVKSRWFASCWQGHWALP